MSSVNTQAATDVAEFVTDLDGGQFERMLATALSQVAAGTVDNDDKGPVLTLRIQNAERHEEEMGQELAALVRLGMEDSQAGGDVPVLLGDYQRGN